MSSVYHPQTDKQLETSVLKHTWDVWVCTGLINEFGGFQWHIGGTIQVTTLLIGLEKFLIFATSLLKFVDLFNYQLRLLSSLTNVDVHERFFIKIKIKKCFRGVRLQTWREIL
jgi:hypothetical protein